MALHVNSPCVNHGHGLRFQLKYYEFDKIHARCEVREIPASLAYALWSFRVAGRDYPLTIDFPPSQDSASAALSCDRVTA